MSIIRVNSYVKLRKLCKGINNNNVVYNSLPNSTLRFQSQDNRWKYEEYQGYDDKAPKNDGLDKDEPSRKEIKRTGNLPLKIGLLFQSLTDPKYELLLEKILIGMVVMGFCGVGTTFVLLIRMLSSRLLQRDTSLTSDCYYPLEDNLTDQLIDFSWGS